MLILMWAGSATAGMGEAPLVEANTTLVAHPQDEATAVVVGTVVLRGFSAAELPVEKQSPMVRHLVEQGRLPPTHLVYTVTIDEVIADSQHELEVGQVVRISAGNAGVPSVWNEVGVRSATAQTQPFEAAFVLADELRGHSLWNQLFAERVFTVAGSADAIIVEETKAACGPRARARNGAPVVDWNESDGLKRLGHPTRGLRDLAEPLAIAHAETDRCAGIPLSVVLEQMRDRAHTAPQ